jgi:hypothetical protein
VTFAPLWIVESCIVLAALCGAAAGYLIAAVRVAKDWL